MNHRRLLTLTVITAIIALILLVAWNVSIKTKLTQSANSMAIVTDEINNDVLNLYKLQQVIGYGGFIHNLKNYVLRKDEQYYDAAIQNLVLAKQVLYDIERKSPQANFVHVESIRATLAEYQIKLLEAKTLVLQGLEVQEIDTQVRVSDAQALNAIEAITNSMLTEYTLANNKAIANVAHVNDLVNLGYFLLIPLLFLVVVVVRLIRGLQKHNREIEETKHDLQSLLDTTPDSILSINIDGEIIRANASAKAFFGYQEALVGMNVDQLLPNDLQSSHANLRKMFFQQPNTRMMAKGRRVQAQTASAECRDVSVSLGHANINDIDLAIVCLRDVTEENVVKLKLEDFRQRVELASDVGRMSFWYWDNEREVMVTDHLDIDSGKHLKQQLLSMDQWLAHIHDDDRELFLDALKHCEQSKEAVTIYYRVKAPKEQFRDMRVIMVPQTESDVPNSVLTEQLRTRTVGMSLDITEQRKVETELVLAREAAESANVAKSQFLANMSHEIRTPMNAITGIMTLLMEARLPEKQARLVRSAYSAGDSLVNIVNDILDFSKLEAGEVSIMNDPFSLDEVLDKLIDLYSVVAQTKSVILQLDVKPDVYISLIGDGLRLGQILGNVLSNAVKFTPAGKVRIRVELVRAHSSSCRLRFSIFDTGIGMNELQIKTIFKPFRQADNSTTREYGGTGLGLSICQRLLDMMGSQMHVNSVLGQGSEFYFEIDFLLQEESKRYQDLIADEKKALVVIEDTNLEETITQYFSHWGVKVACYNNVKRAYNVLQKELEGFDLLLIHFPSEGATNRVLDLCKLWRESHEDRKESLIVITAPANCERTELKELTPIFIVEPPTPSRLFDAINSGKLGLVLSSDKTNMLELARDKTIPIQGAKVLLAEDVKTNQIVAVDFLQTLGLQVDVVENGLEAIESVKNGEYDIVLMDFHMPIMNGIDATKKIRQFKSAEQLPIIAMTAAVFAQDKQAAFDCGMNAHIPKPIQIYQLASTLVDFVQQKRGMTTEAMNVHVEQIESIDLNKLDGIVDLDSVEHNFGHNPVIYQKCLAHYCNDFIDWSCELDRLIDQEEFEDAAKLAHKLKGASANIYATSLSQAASELQSSLKQKDVSQVNRVKNQLAQFLSKLDVLNKLVKGA
ncbi:ATP-binding protein [Pseudoalteromonas sp. SSDWG2]|uniref:hybrid sensor histidine kinase/response regulator n=1 Tax=Pseudoalteromonas sp. SSDWG2 TaxID=3139391 RepID=UPI003BA9647F